MKIQFLGAAGTVTGSKYLVTRGSQRLLIDCGLFQGLKQLRLRNRAPLPFDPATLTAVVLTHAHLDHSGYLPLLVRNGFRGRIHCTAATAELCKLLLPDSGYLQEEDAAYANRHGFSRHHPALPLYTEADAEHCLPYLHPVDYDASIHLGEGLSVQFAPAGHILGAAIVSVSAGARTLVFSGDLGRPHDALMLPPRAIGRADWLVVESTYGDRTHASTDPADELAAAITHTIARGGIVLVPSFAVGRAQELLYYVHRLKAEQRIPSALPVYLNSPMAVDVTGLYRRFAREHRLSRADYETMCRGVNFVNSVEESMHLNTLHRPMIIIAASGMATGGRVIHHLKSLAPDARNLILFSGFQAAGTRGAAMLAGAGQEPKCRGGHGWPGAAAQTIRIHGQDIPVRAEIASMSNLSAHADASEVMQWLGQFHTPPQMTFITHGEPVAADTLRQRIERGLHWECLVPEHGQTCALTD